jgi:cytochrome c2
MRRAVVNRAGIYLARRPRRRRASALVACLLVPVAWTAPVPAAERFPDVQAGQALILEKGCTNCHGILGPGGRQGPDLFRAARGKGSAELLADMWNHIPQMVGALREGEELPSLTGEEMRDLVGYLSFVNYLGDPGNAERGGAQLAEMPCLGCHDLSHPGKIGPALVVPSRAASPVGLVTDIWNHYPNMRAALRNRGLTWFQWDGSLVSDLASYLTSLAPTGKPAPLLAPGDPVEGSRVFNALGCAACHGPQGGRQWADLVLKSNRSSAAENGAALLRHLPSLGEDAGRGRTALRPLTETRMADLLAFLSLAGTELPGGDAGRGEGVFEQKRCSGCHALPGQKPGIGPDVHGMPMAQDAYDVAALMLQHARNMKIVGEMKHVPWPQMEADDLLDLYAFLAAQNHR